MEDTTELEKSLAEYALAREKERKGLEGKISELRDREKRAKGALRAFNPGHPLVKTNGGRPKSQRSQNGWVHPNNMDKVAAWVLGQSEDFAATDVAEGAKVTPGVARSAINVLRESEGVLFTGSRARANSNSNKRADHFRLADREGVEEAVRKNKTAMEKSKGVTNA